LPTSSVRPAPSAAQYRRAANDLRCAAAEVESYGAELARWPVGGAFGGPIATTVCDALADLLSEVNRAGAGLGDLAALCDRRADICDAHARTIDAWWAAGSSGDHTQPYPTPPLPWVDP
jgi:hypothetical protein